MLATLNSVINHTHRCIIMHGSLCLSSVWRAMLQLKVKSNQLWKCSYYEKNHTSLTAANLLLLKRVSLWSFWGKKKSWSFACYHPNKFTYFILLIPSSCSPWGERKVINVWGGCECVCLGGCKWHSSPFKWNSPQDIRAIRALYWTHSDSSRK